MPKDSCIDHPKGYYLEFRRDYVDLFDGDHCAAALMGYFEYATNGELARFKRAGETGEPWVRASVSELIEDTLSLYKTSSIQTRIDRLEKWGLLTIQQSRIGMPRNYLLNVKLTNKFLQDRKVLIVKNNDVEKITPVTTNDVSNDVANDVAPVLNLKVLSPITDHVEDYSLPSSDSPSTSSAVDAIEKHIGHKPSKAERDAIKAAHPYPCGLDEIGEWAVRARLVSKNGGSSLKREPQASRNSATNPRLPARPANTPESAIARSLCTTIPEFLIQCDNQAFSEIVTQYIEHGPAHRVTLTVVEAFWKVFCRFSAEEQSGGADNARVLFPQGYLKNLVDWWGTKPWTAPNLAPLPERPKPVEKMHKSEKMKLDIMEIYYRQNPEKRPVV